MTLTEVQVAEGDNILIHVPKDSVVFYTEGLVDPADLEAAGLKNPVPVLGVPSECVAFAVPEEEK